MLRRLEVQILTITNKVVYGILVLCDILTLLVALICIPIRPAAREACMGLYTLFLLMLFLYQVIVIIRVPLLFIIFVFGHRCLTWLKRLSCCSCLNTVECEQVATFEVYNAHDYAERVNRNLRATSTSLLEDDSERMLNLRDL